MIKNYICIWKFDKMTSRMTYNHGIIIVIPTQLEIIINYSFKNTISSFKVRGLIVWVSKKFL